MLIVKMRGILGCDELPKPKILCEIGRRRERSEKKEFMHQTNHQAREPHGQTYELRAIRSWPSVGHRQLTSSGVLDLEILISKFLAVDTLSAHAISHGEVTFRCYERAQKVEI